MRLLRIFVLLAFTVILGVCIGLYVHLHLTADETVPVITMDKDTISFKSTYDFDNLSLGEIVISDFSAISQGITAYDEKDGDISDKIFAEYSSDFVEPGVFQVVFAVCDSDNHVARATRTVKIENYRSPRFALKDDLVFSPSDKINLNNVIGALDMLEGDISENVLIAVPDYEYGQMGEFAVQVTVSNSKNDTVSCNLPMTVEDFPADAPIIRLKSYLLYVDQGTSFDPRAFIASATDVDGNSLSGVTYRSGVNTQEPGLYAVDYYATDGNGQRGHARLLVMVEGE